MKNTIVLAVLLTAALSASAFLEFFTARSDGSTVRLEWKTGEENNLKSFTVERKSARGTFVTLGSLNAKGDNSVYTYSDDNVFKTTDMIFIYRLRIEDSNNTYSYSKEISVSHSLSDVKRTWGSIKAMFR